MLVGILNLLVMTGVSLFGYATVPAPTPVICAPAP
jgi:hypothetical protein